MAYVGFNSISILSQCEAEIIFGMLVIVHCSCKLMHIIFNISRRIRGDSDFTKIKFTLILTLFFDRNQNTKAIMKSFHNFIVVVKCGSDSISG